MKIRRKTFFNILLIGFVLSFFVTPLGTYSKVWLMQLFSFAPDPIEIGERQRIPTYEWKLKEAGGVFFIFGVGGSPPHGSGLDRPQPPARLLLRVVAVVAAA